MRRFGWAVALLLAASTGAIGHAAPPAHADDTDNVAVLVIDNFQPVPAKPAQHTSSDNCPYSPEDVNVVGDQGAGDDLPAGVPHGKAVYSLLEQRLDTTAGLTRATPRDRADYGLATDPRLGEIKAWSYRDSEVLLVAMDHDRSTTGDIAVRLRDVVNAMQTSKMKFSRFVVNMSFVIGPCNVPLWLKDIGQLNLAATIANYQALIDAHPGLRRFQAALDDLVRDPARIEERILRADPADGLETIRRRVAISEFYDQINKQNGALVRQRTFDDPLKRIIEDGLNSAGRRAIPVAAAGNGVLVKPDGSPLPQRIRFTFPFAPAIWNPVVSVSASDKAQGPRAFYSNSGEVIADGNWTFGAARMRGTSFAAPRLSARYAVYLLVGGEATCQGHVPALGYADSDRGPLSWNDLSVNAASAAYCTDFTRRVLTP